MNVIKILESWATPNWSNALLKKSIKCIKTEPVPRVRGGEASGLASVNG